MQNDGVRRRSRNVLLAQSLGKTVRWASRWSHTINMQYDTDALFRFSSSMFEVASSDKKNEEKMLEVQVQETQVVKKHSSDTISHAAYP
jgi:hypothetical protein